MRDNHILSLDRGAVMAMAAPGDSGVTRTSTPVLSATGKMDFVDWSKERHAATVPFNSVPQHGAF